MTRGLGSDMLVQRFTLMLPSTTWPIWLLTLITIVLDPLISLYYYPALLQSGTLPVNADSISIPILQTFIGAMIIGSIMLTITWLCLRHYKGSVKFFIWRDDKRARSTLFSAFFGIPALLLVGLNVYQYARQVWPWYEYLWLASCAPELLWLLTMRAAAIGQDKYEEFEVYNL